MELLLEILSQCFFSYSWASLFHLMLRSLKTPHYEFQKQHMKDAEAYFYALNDFDDELFHHDGRANVGRPQLLHSPEPSEGWLIPEAEDVYYDAMGIKYSNHDVISHEELLDEDPNSPYRDGAEREMMTVAKNLRGILSAHPKLSSILAHPRPVNEQFCVVDDMEVTVVNIVHTSYATAHGIPPPPITPQARKSRALNKTIIPYTWMWTCLLHLGPQRNHVDTSLKICYPFPFQATGIGFQTGRYLETGAADTDVSRIMFEHVTLQYFRRAGLSSLKIYYRESQNVVATSHMPRGQRMLLHLLKWHLPDLVEYDPDAFPGAVITHPVYKDIIVLVFCSGALVSVGPGSTADTRKVFEDIYPLLEKNIDTPENRALEAQVTRSTPMPSTESASKNSTSTSTSNQANKGDKSSTSAGTARRRGPRQLILGTSV
jgi:TATA-box binding protein (TBP) (component of TFIID and TFIIIB)